MSGVQQRARLGASKAAALLIAGALVVLAGGGTAAWASTHSTHSTHSTGHAGSSSNDTNGAEGGGGAAATHGQKKPAAGPVGPQNLGAYTRVVGATVTLAAGGYLSATASCPAGQVVLGGGESNSAPGTLVLTDSWPSSTTTWLVYVKSSDTIARTFTPYAICGT